MNLTLDDLKNHALKEPEKKYDLSSCTDCLAADLAGVPMTGHHTFSRLVTVDPRWGDFTQALSFSFKSYTGAQIAYAIDRIIAGETPGSVATDLR